MSALNATKEAATNDAVLLRDAVEDSNSASIETAFAELLSGSISNDSKKVSIRSQENITSTRLKKSVQKCVTL